MAISTINQAGLANPLALTTPTATGVTNGSNAATGIVGEFIESAVGPVSVSTSTSPSTALTSITLTAGDWDISGAVQYYGSAGSTAVNIYITTTSGSTGGTLGVNAVVGTGFSGNGTGLANIPRYRQNITSTTTYYLNAWLSGSTNNCYGYLSARRMR